MNERRRALEQALDAARVAEVAAEEAVRQSAETGGAQETWYSLAALRERVRTLSIARERMRQAEDDPGELLARRDPDELDREAARVAAQEQELSSQLEAKARARTLAIHRSSCEDAERGEENRLAALIRAAADRREGWPGLRGQLAAQSWRGGCR